MKYTIKYTVRGTGRFPIDMLRYDESFPYDEHNSGVIMQSLDKGGEWMVTLARHSDDKNWCPGWQRWNSFGCTVKIS